MIKITREQIYGWEAAIRGMRNPLNSWSKSDSYIADGHYFNLGSNDLRLANTLSKAGSDHGKFLRYINVTVDITAPLYWWKEFDQYKIAVVTNSTSTMHKIQSKKFTINDFSYDKMNSTALKSLDQTIEVLENLRQKYLGTKDKQLWYSMIQLLPSSYNQTRTISLNYQVLKAMYYSRKNHKLTEWHDFCEWVEQLPYSSDLITVHDQNSLNGGH